MYVYGIRLFFLPEKHPNPLDQNAAEMSFGLLEMSFGVLEMSFEDIAGGFCALEISYGLSMVKNALKTALFITYGA